MTTSTETKVKPCQGILPAFLTCSPLSVSFSLLLIEKGIFRCSPVLPLFLFNLLLCKPQMQRNACNRAEPSLTSKFVSLWRRSLPPDKQQPTELLCEQTLHCLFSVFSSLSASEKKSRPWSGNQNEKPNAVLYCLRLFQSSWDLSIRQERQDLKKPPFLI